MPKLKKFGTYIFVTYMTVMLLLHIMPFGSEVAALNKIKVIDIRLDYLLHAIVFIPWAIIVWWAYGVSFRQNPGKTIFWAACGAIFAAGVEYIQLYLNYRTFNINDVLGNVAGVVLGGVVFFWKPPAEPLK